MAYTVSSPDSSDSITKPPGRALTVSSDISTSSMPDPFTSLPMTRDQMDSVPLYDTAFMRYSIKPPTTSLSAKKVVCPIL